MATKYRGDRNQLPCGGYIAEGRGQCSVCHKVIQKGEVFYWSGNRPAAVECRKCAGLPEWPEDEE